MLNTTRAENLGIIIVDHGSRLASANNMLDDVVALFRRVSGCNIVEPAHMELASPTIAEAFAACVRQGATRVVVHPYFLSPGRHSTTDIPRLVAEAAKEHSPVAFHITPPLGLDEKIAHVIMARITDCGRRNYSCDYCQTRGRHQREVCETNKYICNSCRTAGCPNAPPGAAVR